MNAKQRQLRLQDYLEHMLEASRLAQQYLAGIDKTELILCQLNDPAGRADEHRHHW
ncbi:ribonuclease HepT family protein [Caballeronia mineralivorans]|uniref:hypothetical protein n=1 Tax=Caballeronia mineralivorans TaxID=2010198 RepID=UPI001364C495|nr:hypothetical protein [Caballeronia mineralivorans]